MELNLLGWFEVGIVQVTIRSKMLDYSKYNRNKIMNLQKQNKYKVLLFSPRHI